MAVDRMRKVNEQIRSKVAESLSRDVELPLDTFVTVVSVETSRDLRFATVFVMVLPDGKRVSTMKKLAGQKHVVQRALANALKMKFTPKIRFEFDEAGIRGQRIYDILDEQYEGE